LSAASADGLVEAADGLSDAAGVHEALLVLVSPYDGCPAPNIAAVPVLVVRLQ
jgi:hypothetical protein